MGDAEKRGRYDRGEIDASGNERPRERYYRDFQEPGAETHSYSNNEGYADFMDEDVLREMFSRGGGGARFRARGQDTLYRLPVDFLEAINGATKRITMPDGGTLDVVIPPGTKDKQVLRLRGKGGPGLGGGPAGTPWSRSRFSRTSSSPATATTSASSFRSACRRQCWERSSTSPPRPAPCA